MASVKECVLANGFALMTEEELYSVNGGWGHSGKSGSSGKTNSSGKSGSSSGTPISIPSGAGKSGNSSSGKTGNGKGTVTVGPTTGPAGKPGISITIHF